MKYLCLIYVDENQLEAAPEALMDRVAEQCREHTGELTSSGHLVACERLRPTRDAATVRHRHDKVSVTDGPFAETREQLAGFYLINARDMNEAIRIASRIPPGQFGCIEVRPVMEDE